MDAKITLSFDRQIIAQAKEFAAENNISLSRLTEFIFRQITSKNYKTLDDFPIAEWVHTIAEEKPNYTKPISRKKMKSEFFESNK